MTALCGLAERHSTGYSTRTAIPGLELRTGYSLTGPTPDLYQPMVCYVLQGAKTASIGDRSMRYEGASYMIASVTLPVTAQIVAASPDRPYLAIGLALDQAAISSLLLDAPVSECEDPLPGVGVSPLTADLVEPMLRMMRLLDAPDDIPVLEPLIVREIVYRLIQGPQGGMLRQISGTADSRFVRIRRVIHWIREHCTERLRIETLAEIAGMSPSSLHRHFRTVTAMSPLQYHKTMRLHEARRRLFGNSGNVAEVAYAVGYESPSQFSREYARQFGVSPAGDVSELRRATNA